MESKKCKAVATRDPAMLTVNARSEIRARSSNSACFDCPAVSGGADSACIHSLAQGTGPWRRTCGRTHRPMRCGGRRRPITRRNYARSASARPRRDLRRMRTARPFQHGRIPPDRRHVPSASIAGAVELPRDLGDIGEPQESAKRHLCPAGQHREWSATGKQRGAARAGGRNH